MPIFIGGRPCIYRPLTSSFALQWVLTHCRSLVLLQLCSLGEAFAKDYLVIYKPSKQQRYYYYVGDQIKLRPQRNFPMRSGAIYAFSDSALYFSPDDSILYSEIDYIQLHVSIRACTSCYDG